MGERKAGGDRREAKRLKVYKNQLNQASEEEEQKETEDKNYPGIEV